MTWGSLGSFLPATELSACEGSMIPRVMGVSQDEDNRDSRVAGHRPPAVNRYRVDQRSIRGARRKNGGRRGHAERRARRAAGRRPRGWGWGWRVSLVRNLQV